MRLLFINSGKADYVEDQLVSGLTQILGKDSVELFPRNIKYYFPRRPYPRDMGLCRNSADYFLDKFSGLRRIKRGEYDAVVIGSTKKDTFAAFLSLSPLLSRNIPVVYVDGGDWPEIGGDAERMRFSGLFKEIREQWKFSVIFKREYLVNKYYDKNVIPFPMAFPRNKKIGISAAKYDVTCWCVESHAIRSTALNILENRYDCRLNGTTKGQQFRSYKRKGNNYLRELSASKIACNFRGAGWDTLRYWEIPALKAFMISTKPQIIIPNDFKSGEHVAFCQDDLCDLTKLIDYYLRNSAERVQMADNANRHLNKYHTNIQRAELFVEELRNHLPHCS